MPDGSSIQRMFAEVADRYDRANRLLSWGVDGSWRRAAIRFAGVRAGEVALDVCAGTGDLTLALCAAGARAVGADFCRPMLARAVQKARRAERAAGFLCADAMALPFPSGTFDLSAVAFGIRNVQDPVAALREMARVVRPGGRVIVLEFCRPKGPLFGRAYWFYFRRVLPRLGRWISGAKNGAYDYLPESVRRFPERDDFLDLMGSAGLSRTGFRLLSGGIAAVYRGEVEG